jgi:membrane protease YdiL (CAAX protease family)
VAVLVAGSLHVLVEIGFSDAVARAYNAVVSVAFLVYLVRRARRTPGALRVWGMRRDNFRPALRAQLVFVAVGAAALVVYGAATGSLSLPATFWTTVALYPIWGVAQQFALQNLLARNLTRVLATPPALALGAAVLFALSHVPRWELVVLTLVAGVAFTLIYRRFPNLWAVGIAHGVLGSLAAYIVLREDPGAALLGFLTIK